LPRPRLLLGVIAMIIGLGLVWGVASWKRAAAKPVLDWSSEAIDGLHYEVLLPADYRSTGHYPVLLYMHQYAMGNYRDGLLKQVEAWFGTNTFRARHPAIIIVPMLDQAKDPGANFGGQRGGHSWEDVTIAALSQTMQRYSVDPARIYVTGNSLGGTGTWDMLISYNALTGSKGHIFAAGMPLAGMLHTAPSTCCRWNSGRRGVLIGGRRQA
jgi:predicted peptidase